MSVQAQFNHFNFNVRDLDASVAFYGKALGLTEARRKEAADGSFTLVFLADEAGSPFRLELTWLRDHPQAYDLGEQEFHLAVTVDDYEAARAAHKAMGCVSYENDAMGIYFIEDPDGYWIEILPARR